MLNYGTDKVMVLLSGTDGDTVLILTTEENGQVNKVAEYSLEKKVQRLALDANLSHGEAKFDESINANDNEFYIERSSGAGSGMPLSMMNFGGFGGGDEAEESQPAFLVQTLDKTVSKLTLEDNFFTEDMLFTTAHSYQKM